MRVMLFGRRRSQGGNVRTGSEADTSHLAEFVRTRAGVEAYLEPRTTVTETTVLLVADDGEWTRRRVDGMRGAQSFARRNRLPLYDVTVVGYPKRMREYNARRKRQG